MNEKENHKISSAAGETAGKGAVNLLIFEQVLGATRQKLPGNFCGLVYAASTYICFEGHDRFEISACWEEHYHGPDFCDDLTWVFTAQAAAGQAGLTGAYVEALVKAVCPNWNQLKTSSEVLKFWYALANASSTQRALALASAIRSLSNLEQVVERALQLALPIAQAEGEAKSTAMQPFIEFVRNLQPQRADELLAIMYLGRGDCATFAEMLRIVAGSAFDATGLARQMAGKVPLTRYLQDGLARWRAEQRG
jgi:Protein of unknown function (DUF3775)